MKEALKAFLPIILFALGFVAITIHAWSEEVSESDYYTFGDHLSAVCIDGTEYWTSTHWNKSHFAVRIDPQTRAPKACR